MIGAIRSPVLPKQSGGAFVSVPQRGFAYSPGLPRFGGYPGKETIA